MTSNTTKNTDKILLLLSPEDNVLVARCSINAHQKICVEGKDLSISHPVAMGHKIARYQINTGEKILKYGLPIGVATEVIALGDHVHTHNIRSEYTPTYELFNGTSDDRAGS